MTKGEKHNKLTFIENTTKRFVPSGAGRMFGLFRCDCGVVKEVAVSPVQCGTIKSCGCVGIEKLRKMGKITGEKKSTYRHGFFGTRFYSIWFGGKARCEYPKHASYKFYGAKGIKFLYKDFLDFKNDLHDSYVEHIKTYGEKETTLERIDNKKHYQKGNCRWATYKEQARNRSNNTFITLDGEKKVLAEWVDKMKMSRHLIQKRANQQESIK